MRNVQFLEMQEIDRGTSREHLLIDFSSSSSSDELDASKRENEEGGILSRGISPAASDIGVLPSHRLLDDTEVPLVDLAPGRKVVPLVDLGDIEDGLGVTQEEEDTWKWFVPPLSGKIHFESTPTSMVTPISKSISEPLPITSPPLAMSEGKLIDFHSGPDQEHVLVDLDVQDDNNVPQQEQLEFTRVHTTRVDLDAVVSEPPTTITKAILPLDDPPEGRGSLDALITTPPVDILLEESSQRGRRVDRHPLEEVGEMAIPEKTEDKEQQQHELYDHHDIYDHHSPQSIDTFRASSLSPQLVTIPVQAAPAWHWDDPWNGAVGLVNEEAELSGETEVAEEHGEKVEVDGEKGVEEIGEDKVLELPVESSLEEVPTETEDEKSYPDLLEADLEIGVDGARESSLEEVPTKTEDEHSYPDPDYLPLEADLEIGEDEALESPLEEVPTKDEQSYPDPDYLPLPELLLGPSSPADIPLVLVEHESPNSFQKDENEDAQQQFKDDEKSPRRTQMPTPPASPPPTSPLRVKGLLRSGPPSPNSLSPSASLLSLSTPQSTSPKLAPSTRLNTSSLSPVIAKIKVKVSEEDKENVEVDKEIESPNSATGRPLWSIRADDAPALGLAASSLSTTSSVGLIPSVGTNMGISPRMRRKVLGDITSVVENGEREEKEKEAVVKEDILKEEKDEEGEEESPLPGAFPEPVKPTSVAPTITIAALTSTLLSTSIVAASSSVSTTSSSTAVEPIIKRRPITRSPLDIALAMQLRPGLGVGADPAWMVRFLMAMFGWFAILVSGQGEF